MLESIKIEYERRKKDADQLAIELSLPLYVRDKTMHGFYYLAFLPENEHIKIWIDPDNSNYVQIEKSNDSPFFTDYLDTKEDYEEIAEIEFLEKLNLAKSLI